MHACTYIFIYMHLCTLYKCFPVVNSFYLWKASFSIAVLFVI